MLPAALLLLADGRSPTGSYLHSGGVEAAIAGGWVRDDADLLAFLQGRLHTVGRVTAGLAAAATEPDADLAQLDAEADARTLAPAARDASRAQGRALLRMVRAAWPNARADLGARPHAALVLGVATAAAGGSPADAAALAAGGAVTGPASAAVRLLGLDPLGVTGLLAALAPAVDEVAASAARDAADGRLPDDSAPQLDVLAEVHAELPPTGVAARVRMFAS